MSIAKGLSRVALLSLTTAASSVGQVPIQGVDFDTVPVDATLSATDITLQGNTVIQGGAQVSGNVTLGPGASIAFNPPRAGVKILGAASFSPGDLVSNQPYWVDLGDWVNHPPTVSIIVFGIIGVAPLDLPVGSLLTGFRCWFYDNDASVDFDAGTSGQIVIWTPPNDFANIQVSTPVVTGSHESTTLIETIAVTGLPVLIQSSQAYAVRFFANFVPGTTSPQNLRFYGCRVDYEVSTWMP